MPRVSGSLVTVDDLIGMYLPYGGVNPPANNTRILSYDEIGALFMNCVDIYTKQCPSWNQLIPAPPKSTVNYDFSVFTAGVRLYIKLPGGAEVLNVTTTSTGSVTLIEATYEIGVTGALGYKWIRIVDKNSAVLHDNYMDVPTFSTNQNLNNARSPFTIQANG